VPLNNPNNSDVQFACTQEELEMLPCTLPGIVLQCCCTQLKPASNSLASAASAQGAVLGALGSEPS
jgi:hypothetical protein